MNLKEIIHGLSTAEGVTISEDLRTFAAYSMACTRSDLLTAIQSLHKHLSDLNLGAVDLYGKVSGKINIDGATFEQIQKEPLDVIVNKYPSDTWAFFFTAPGLSKALREDKKFASEVRAIWVLDEFEGFSTFSSCYSPWEGPAEYQRPIADKLEDPRRLVRDLTQSRTPNDIAPWLLVQRPKGESAVFAAWRQLATERLGFCLPTEVGTEAGKEYVQIRGSRSLKLSLDTPPCLNDAALFDLATEAATWVYELKRESESKHLFLNEHLSQALSNVDTWPNGLTSTLADSLANARTSFAFHLQDESRDSLKAMGDLRKSLQDEVLKTQQTTRDVLTTLWRDFAIAATVLAVRYLPSPVSGALPEARWLSGGVAAFLFVSLAVTLASNARFNYLAAQNRRLWRNRIYAFVPQQEWDSLVAGQLAKVAWVFRSVMIVVALIYLGLIGWLVQPYLPAFGCWIFKVTGLNW